MAKSTPGTCAFCGLPFDKTAGRERTEEHALPSWTLDVIPGKALPITHTRHPRPGRPEAQVWDADQFEIVAKRVCKECNGGWMNDLENEARRHLIPMIQGRGVQLYREGQTSVAAWAVKTSLALHLTTPEKDAPVEHYREIATTHRAPAQTRVWLAAYTDLAAGIASHHSSILNIDSPTYHAKGYATTFGVGHLVCQVFGWVGGEDFTVSHRRWERALVAIWPYAVEPKIWPPLEALNNAGLRALGRAFESP